MPQLQVLQRQDDQGASAYQNFQENMRKQQEMLMKAKELGANIAIAKQTAATNAKNATTEEEKFKLTRKAAALTRAENIFKTAIKTATTKDGGIDDPLYSKIMTTAITNSRDDEMAQALQEQFKLGQGRQLGDTGAAKDVADIRKTNAEIPRLGSEAGKFDQEAAKEEQVARMLRLQNDANSQAHQGGAPPVTGVAGPGGTDVNQVTPPTAPVQQPPTQDMRGTGVTSLNIDGIGITPPAYYDKVSREAALKKEADIQIGKREGVVPSAGERQAWGDAASAMNDVTASISTALDNPQFEAYMGSRLDKQIRRGLAGAEWAGDKIYNPRVEGFKAMTEDVFAQYRKVITGAQASMQEIEYLRKIIGTTDDTYDTFLVKNMIIASASLARLSSRIKTSKSMFVDTGALEDVRNEMAAQLEKLKTGVNARGLDVDSLLHKLSLTERDDAIIRALAVGANLEQATAAWKESQAGGK